MSGEGGGGYWLTLLRDWGLAGIVVIAAFATFQWIFNPPPLSHGPAPDFTLPSLEGGQIAMADYRDKTVILNFWFSDCAPCRQEIPELAHWSEAHPEVPLIGVSTDRMDPSQVRTRALQLGVTYPVAHDMYARVAQDYHVNVFPTTMVVSGGEIRAVRVGAVNRTTLDDLVTYAP